MFVSLTRISNMVILRYRKVKVLLLVILLFILNGVYSTDSLNVPNLIHLIKNGTDGEEGLCIAFGEETYSAIEWSYPIPDDEHSLPETVSTYLPQQSSLHNCNFEQDQECNNRWKLDNWNIPIHTSRNFVPIVDTRWEDFRTYLTTNKTNIIENRLEIPLNSSIGISIRSGSSVNILLCEGYNPEHYPCYTITIGGNTRKEVYITKHGDERKMSEYESDSFVLSIDEWKNFNLTLLEIGQIHLKEINKNFCYLNISGLESLKTLYLFIHSSLPSLWKIHKNHFIFTNSSKFVSFGPPINATSSTACLSMYLMMCKNCSIFFYTVVNITKEIVLQVHATNNENISYEWKAIKILIENVTDDTIQLYVKTRSNSTDRFWALDNIRSCIKDEFKVRKLSKGNFNKNLNFSDLPLSCHSLKFPAWRPKKQVITLTELPIISNSASTTSIELAWKTTYQQPLLISYKGNDICSKDTISRHKSVHRLKSNGWIIVRSKENKITIKNLVPYTHYSVTLIDPVYGKNKTLFMNTSPTVKLTKNELPAITITSKTNEATINISARKCNISYGPVVYRLDIMQHSNPYILFENNLYTFKNLEPYRNYTLSAETARSIKNLNNTSLKAISYYNFTTKPDVAPQLNFIELYESSETSMSFRYKLPENSKGQPIVLQVASCTPFLRNNCSYNNFNITRCKLWKDLYCVTVNNLIKRKPYTFKLSIKNKNTNAFGKEFIFSRTTVEMVPGAPTNLSYKVINCSKETEYCNLNISWSHPYKQNGVITSFEIFLQHDEQLITEYFLIEDKQYLPTYSHVVRYIPYAKTYNVTIRGCNNAYKGFLTSMTVNIDHIAQHIDHSPTFIVNAENGVIFQMPKLDYRLNSSEIVVIVQANDNTFAKIPKILISLAGDGLCLYNKTSWIAGVWKMSHINPINITIGNNAKMLTDIMNDTVVNKPLSAKVEYCLNFIIKSAYKDIEHVTVYHKRYSVPEIERKLVVPIPKSLSVGSIIVLILLVLLLVTITVFAVLMYRKRKRRFPGRSRTRSEGEQIYEAMPCDDYSDNYNVVYNAIYDKLNHD